MPVPFVSSGTDSQVWGSVRDTSQRVSPSRHFNLQTPLCWDWGHLAVSLLPFFCRLPPYMKRYTWMLFHWGGEALTCTSSGFPASPEKWSGFGVLGSTGLWSALDSGLGRWLLTMTGMPCMDITTSVFVKLQRWVTFLLNLKFTAKLEIHTCAVLPKQVPLNSDVRLAYANRYYKLFSRLISPSSFTTYNFLL